MPSFEHNGASIYYETFGQGFPILTFAPAGLQSVIDVWNQPSAPVNPNSEFIPEWKEGAPLAAATARMKQFLADHTSVRA